VETAFLPIFLHPLLAAHDQVIVDHINIEIVLVHSRGLEPHRDSVLVFLHLSGQQAPVGRVSDYLVFPGIQIILFGQGAEARHGMLRTLTELMPALGEVFPGPAQTVT
jgi:hypothetical protein